MHRVSRFVNQCTSLKTLQVSSFSRWNMAASATEYDYDLIVLGGGSGGSAAARRAAEYGAKVCVFEQSRYGGTCVNVGCVPKKIMFMTSNMANILKNHAPQYCFNYDQSSVTLDYALLKQKRDKYIKFLNGIYEGNFNRAGITHVEGHATFVDPNTIVASRIDPETNKNVYEGQKWTAKKILIAVGGFPYIPNIPGKEYIQTSDDFFNKLDYLPSKVCVVGAGYIAVELAQVLQGLGSEVHLFLRHELALRKFDIMIQKGVMSALIHSGVTVHINSNIKEVKQMDGQTDAKSGKQVYSVTCQENDTCFEGFDYVLYAIGRGPLQEELGLDKLPKLEQDKRGFIISDEYEQTGQPNVYALGDINNKIALTPVAIRAGRKFSDREFGGKEGSKMDYTNVPSVVFSEPPVGSCGLPEYEVRELVAAGKLEGPVTVYESHFRNLYYGIMEEKYKVRTHMKLVCIGANEKVVGLHLFGEGSDEMLQGFGVAMKMGATKEDFDSVTAIHPTAAEELVTMKKPRASEQDSYVYDYEKESKQDQ